MLQQNRRQTVKNNIMKLTAFAAISILMVIVSIHLIGCGTGAVVDDGNGGGSAGWISGRYPALGGSVTAKNVNMSITFNRDMNTLEAAFDTGASHTAGEAVTYEAYWSSDRTFNIYVVGPLSVESGNVVQLVADTDGFRAASGDYMPAGTELWRFTYDYNTLESYSISGTITQSFGTTEGIIYVLAYDHTPTGYNDAGAVGFVTMESPGAYTISDLGNGTGYYVNAYRNVFGTPMQWYHGYPSGQNGPIDISSGSAEGRNIDLTADPLAVESVYPAIGAGGIPKAVNLRVTFNNAIRYWTLSEHSITFGPSHEAGAPDGNEPIISDDLRTLTITMEGWTGGTGNQVDIRTTSESRIIDANADHLPDGALLWYYELAAHTVSGTITGGTNEMIAIYLATDEAFNFATTVWATLENGSANYSFGGLNDGTYYVAAEGYGNLVGIYKYTGQSPSPITVSGSSRTNIDFPVTYYTGLAGAFNSYGISGEVTTATSESYYVHVVMSTSEGFFSGGDSVIHGDYMVQPPTVAYHFTGLPLASDTYYIAAWQDIPPINTGYSPEAGDYVGTAEATISGGNVINADIHMMPWGP